MHHVWWWCWPVHLYDPPSFSSIWIRVLAGGICCCRHLCDSRGMLNVQVLNSILIIEKTLKIYPIRFRWWWWLCFPFIHIDSYSFFLVGTALEKHGTYHLFGLTCRPALSAEEYVTAGIEEPTDSSGFFFFLPFERPDFLVILFWCFIVLILICNLVGGVDVEWWALVSFFCFLK